jgi:pimeloyl-ACP methyl ester carboxylesterase
MMTRRAFLGSAAAVTLYDPRASAADVAPIVFVHGNGDSRAFWEPTVWRFESNGYPRERLFTFNFRDPLSRDTNSRRQEFRSSTDDQLIQLAAAIDTVLRATGADKVALVASSRGGNAVRNYLADGGAPKVSRAVLGGTPAHGAVALPTFILDFLNGNGESEFNGRGAFLRRLNGGTSETPAGVPMLTLRSDEYDLFEQPYGTFLGFPHVPTLVGRDSASLKGATNLVLEHADHRETATGPQAFAATYEFLLGRAPDRIAIVPEGRIVLNGQVTGAVMGVVEGVWTNRPVTNARVEVHAVDADTGARLGDPLLTRTTGPDGVWGPLETNSETTLEFVVTAPGAPITHIYRSRIPRSFDGFDLRPWWVPPDADAGAVVILSRPRGYFSASRDLILLDGKTPADVPPGIPAVWNAKVVLPTGEDRPVVALFNEERIVARPWPARENHIAIAELTY